MPYLVLKVLWTAGVPVGVTDRSVLDSSEWVAGNAVMAVVQLVGLLLVLTLTQRWARRVPVWLLLLPVWVGTGLLFQVAAGAVLTGLFPVSPPSSGVSTEGIRPWVFVMVYSSFAGQGIALAVAFARHVRARWGRLLGRRTSEVMARRIAPAGLGIWAKVVAGLAFGVALVCGYWAAGGSFGLPGAGSLPARALQASRVAGAVTAVVGLLGLTGRWGRRSRFWLPAALIWLGSGALAAFDGFTVVLNRLFLVFGAAASQPGWTLLDTVLVIKVVIGLLAGAVGALAVATAARASRGA